jgi:hypothetical protein
LGVEQPITLKRPTSSRGAPLRLVADGLRLLGAVLALPWVRRPVRVLPGEGAQPLPGDEMVASPKVAWTHAITIDAPPGRVWPWLAQMGCRRAGWYSYDGLDNGGAQSADRIVPELQRVEVGDIFPMTPKAEDAFLVRAVEPERELVLGDAGGAASWAFVLEPVGETSTRLLTRSSGSYRHLMGGLLLRVFLRPVHFGMQRRQLLNVKRRVEVLS